MDVRSFVICLENEGYSASLELHKIYAVVEPLANDPEDYVRIIDESGEDYLFPDSWFEAVNLGTKLEERLMRSVPA